MILMEVIMMKKKKKRIENKNILNQVDEVTILRDCWNDGSPCIKNCVDQK